MSEVEKMYSNAGIKPLPTCNNCNMLDEYWSNGTYCSTCKCDKDNDECNMANYIYPPFTAEKQLELIKWLADRFLELSKYKDVANNNKTMYGIRTDVGTYACSHQEKFEEMLAGLINNLWQDLIEEDKQQVKGILE